MNHHHTDHTDHETMFRNRFWISLILTIPVLLFSPMIQIWFGFQIPSFMGSNFVGPLFSVAIFLYGGIPFIQMAVPEIKNGKPGMMTLISLAITVAFGYSFFAVFSDTGKRFFWEMATLIDVMLLGHWMEMRSVRQASGALNALAKLLPDTAERLDENGNPEEVKLDELNPDDLILVRPGANIPVDGIVKEGHSNVNEATITGESQPVEKSAGSKVIGGTLNGDGSLRVQVTATGDDTALAGIMRLVEEAQNSKSDTQILADQAAGWLFYIAIATAVMTTIGWTLAIGWKLEVLERVITVLVIACPHALGLAIPLVVAISTAMGASNGVLIRDRLAMEKIREIDVVVFDKTGTLTKGHFGVTNIATSDNWTAQEALAFAAGIEGDSEHPIARGIRQKAQDENATAKTITDFEIIKGRGVKAAYEGKILHLGGPNLLDLLDVSLKTPFDEFTREAKDNAQSVIYLLVDKQIVAAFTLADVIRETSIKAIKQLHDMDIQVAMLTGDSEAVARAVAKQLNIDLVFAEVLPEHKDQKIQELQQNGKKVAMVGDGVNDAPALARADVGIAIGSGTDVAIESAGIILVQSDPLDVIKIFKLGRATYRKMIENLIWATGYNVLALPLAAGVLAPIGFILSPAVGAAFMSLSTVVVAINAQLLRRTDLAISY